jgi:hypothetical protein
MICFDTSIIAFRNFRPSRNEKNICFPDSLLRLVNWPDLSARKKLGESWLTFPGTKIVQFVLSEQLNLSLMSQDTNRSRWKSAFDAFMVVV